MLPSTPPSIDELRLYVDSNKKSYYLLAIPSLLLLVIGMCLFIFLKPGFIIFLPWLLLFVLYLSMSYYIGINGKNFSFETHSIFVEWFKYEAPDVDVFIPCCGENINVIRNTIHHATQISWPNEKLHVYVLDDGKDENVKIAASLYGATYLTRKNLELRKAGNLRAAFGRTSSPFILILDCDFAARRDILLHTIPYLLADSKTAIVQTPQYFCTKSSEGWLQKGAAYVQELFYRLVQQSRQYMGKGAAICVGSCAVYRRQALKPFGGTYPINFSEDVHTGYQLIDHGWKIKYLPINLAKGLCPASIRQFFTQQLRWCRGSLSLCCNPMFWFSPVHVQTKLAYISGFLYYLATGIGVFLIPLPSILMVWFAPEWVFWHNMLYYLPSFLFGTIFLAKWTRAPFGLYALQARMVSYYAHFFGILETLTNKEFVWIPTGVKQHARDNYDRFINVFWIWSGLSYFLIVSGAVCHMKEITNVHFWPHIAFSSFYFFCQLRILLTAHEEARNKV